MVECKESTTLANMGAGLCSFKRPATDEQQRWSTTSRPRNPTQKKRLIKSLEDCLLDSPSLKPESLVGGELHVLKQTSKKHLPSDKTRVHPQLVSCKSRKYQLMEEVVKAIVDRQEKDVDGLLSRNQSGKSSKRVSFREDANVVIIYSSPRHDDLED